MALHAFNEKFFSCFYGCPCNEACFLITAYADIPDGEYYYHFTQDYDGWEGAIILCSKDADGKKSPIKISQQFLEDNGYKFVSIRDYIFIYQNRQVLLFRFDDGITTFTRPNTIVHAYTIDHVFAMFRHFMYGK